MHNKVLAAAITIIIVITLITVPLVLIATNVVKESVVLYKSGTINNLVESVTSHFSETGTLSSFITNNYENIISYIASLASDFLKKVPSKLVDLLIIVYGTFTLLLSGEMFVKKVRSFIPVKKKDELMKHLGDTIYAIVYGLFVTAVIVSILAFVGFEILGIKPALLLSLLVGLLVLVPLLGPGIVWIPLAIFHLAYGNIFTVVCLVILCIILSVVETFSRARLIGEKARLHPLVVIIGIIGGVKVLGFIGLVAGPLIFSSLLIIIKEYYPELEDEA